VGQKGLEGEEVESGSQMITCKLCGINQDLDWFITVVYASYDRNERRDLWEEL